MDLMRPSTVVNFLRKSISNIRVTSEVISQQYHRDSNGVSKIEKQRSSEKSQDINTHGDEKRRTSVLIIPKNDVLDEKLANLAKDGHLNDFNSRFEIQRGDFALDDSLHGFTPKVPKALDPSTEDLSDLGSNYRQTFNIASYADKSPTIQEFVKLGVEVWKFDRDLSLVKELISYDFERDVKPYILFLHNMGVPADKLGNFITKNPYIFQTDMDNLQTRIRYLIAHKFSCEMIAEIITKHPYWLHYTTKDIDTKLGYFQHEFKLRGDEIRLLTLKRPQVITHNWTMLEEQTFALKKVMGFELSQLKAMLLKLPRLWTKSRHNVTETFDYAHNTMNLSHEQLTAQPQVLLCRRKRLELRHQFLVILKKAQFDPSKPMYISPLSLISGSDAEFCENLAKVSVITYDMFLKSL